MTTSAGKKPPPKAHVVEAKLRLSDEGVVAGTVGASETEPATFHGWLELMDAIESIRARAAHRPHST